jgi:hypothetical protein
MCSDAGRLADAVEQSCKWTAPLTQHLENLRIRTECLFAVVFVRGAFDTVFIRGEDEV